MKTRSIYLQPNECVEVFNTFGTSLIKARAMFADQQPVVIIYPQPGVFDYVSAGIQEQDFTPLPEGE
jgi:hypothetical protein